MRQQKQQQYVAKKTTIAMIWWCSTVRKKQYQVITAPYRHVRNSSSDRYSNSDPEVAATAAVAVLQW